MSTKITNLAKFMVLNIISLSASQSSKPEMLEYGGALFFICRVFDQFGFSLVFFIGYLFGGAPFFICRVFYQFDFSLVFFIGYFLIGGALLENFN